MKHSCGRLNDGRRCLCWPELAARRLFITAADVKSGFEGAEWRDN